MRANFPRCSANTHREEGSDTPSGGWTIDRDDPGNWTGGKKGVGELCGTKWGIAANSAKRLGIDPHKIRTMTRAQADAIYLKFYWRDAWGDDWPMGIDQITYDATVNSGPGRGPLWTCRALGFTKADRAAPEKARMLTTDGKVAAIKRAVSGQRMGFLRGLPTFWKFGKGWTGRCARMEAIGVKMVLEDAKASPATIEKTLTKESGQAKSTSNKAGGAAGGTAAGGGGATTQVDPSVWTWTDWVIAGGIALALLALLAWLGWQAWKHRERARAYLDAALGRIG